MIVKQHNSEQTETLFMRMRRLHAIHGVFAVAPWLGRGDLLSHAASGFIGRRANTERRTVALVRRFVRSWNRGIHLRPRVTSNLRTGLPDSLSSTVCGSCMALLLLEIAGTLAKRRRKNQCLTMRLRATARLR